MRKSTFSVACALAIAAPAGAQSITSGSAATNANESALIDGDAAVCAAGKTLSIAIVEHNANGSGTVKRVVLQASVKPVCQWRVDNLSSGDYEVEVTSSRGIIGAATFRVLPGEVSRVHVARSTVVVRGRVTVNGQPVAGASLLFTPSATVPRVTTNKDGAFETMLPVAGEYRAHLSGNSIYSQGRSASFKAGSTQWDWNLPAGTLNVHFLAGDRPREGRIGVQIVDLESGATQVRFVAVGESVVTIQGVPFGTYQVFAGSGTSAPGFERASKGAVAVSVSAAIPAQDVYVPVNADIAPAP